MPFPRGRSPRATLHRARFLIANVARHKWLVFLEGRRHGATLRSRLTHDADKFRPGYLWRWIVLDQAEVCDRLHRTRAPHQWEWWLTEGNPATVRPMSGAARREMLADWCARQRERGGTPAEYTRRVLDVYLQRKDSIHLHPDTRTWVEHRLQALSSSAP